MRSSTKAPRRYRAREVADSLATLDTEKAALKDSFEVLGKGSTVSDIRGVESSTISFINFSILGSNNRFFDKLYDGSWSESSIYIAKIT